MRAIEEAAMLPSSVSGKSVMERGGTQRPSRSSRLAGEGSTTAENSRPMGRFKKACESRKEGKGAKRSVGEEGEVMEEGGAAVAVGRTGSVCVDNVGSCYDPAWDRRAIAQVKSACDIRGREADYLPSPRVCVRGGRGITRQDSGKSAE